MIPRDDVYHPTQEAELVGPHSSLLRNSTLGLLSCITLSIGEDVDPAPQDGPPAEESCPTPHSPVRGGESRSGEREEEGDDVRIGKLELKGYQEAARCVARKRKISEFPCKLYLHSL